MKKLITIILCMYAGLTFGQGSMVNNSAQRNATTGVVQVLNVGTGFKDTLVTKNTSAFIRNQLTLQSSSNFWLSGVGRAPTLKATSQLFVGQERLIDTAYNQSRQLMLKGNRGDSSTVFVVRQEFNGVGSTRNIAASNVQSPDGLGGYFQGGMHIYGSNYHRPEFIGKLNLTNDNGGTILRSINALPDSSKLQFVAGDSGDLFDDIQMEIRGGASRGGYVGLGIDPTSDTKFKVRSRKAGAGIQSQITVASGSNTSINAIADGVGATLNRGLYISASGATTNEAIRVDGTAPSYFGGSVTVPDDAYDSGWNGDLTAPTKNAIWDAGFLTSAGAVTSITGTANQITASASTGAVTLSLPSTVTGTSAINGGTASNDDITIQGTTNATRTTSYVNLQPNGGFVGIGLTTPLKPLQVRTGTDQNLAVRTGTEVGGANGVAISSRTDDDSALQDLSIRASNINLIPSGNVVLNTAPTTSAGTYDILTRNTSTGVVEKVSSSSFGVGSKYVPTYTNVANTTAVSSGGDSFYTRTNNIVTVRGFVTFQTVLGVNTSTIISVTLPVASDFTTSTDAFGDAPAGAPGTATTSANIVSNAASNLAYIQCSSLLPTANGAFMYSFTYEVK